MATEYHPLPRDALPPGWGPADAADGHLSYRRSRPTVELIAEQTDADRAHPALGLGTYWELRLRRVVGETSVSDVIGRVSTRRAAIDGLLESMERINDVVAHSGDALEMPSVLDRVRLDDVVPDWTNRGQP